MMTSAIISKVEKASRYAHEPDRLTFSTLDLEVRGDNGTHRVSLGPDDWSCTCDFFAHHGGSCAHVLTVQKILGTMLPESARVSIYEVLEAERDQEMNFAPV